MGNKISSDVGGFFERNIGGILSDVGLGIMTIVQPELAPFTLTGIAASTAGMVGSEVMGSKARGAQARANLTAQEAQQAIESAKANAIFEMKNGAQGGAAAGKAIAMISALQSGAPISQAASAAGYSPAGTRITGLAVRAASMKALGGGLGGGSTQAALHFGDPLQMTARSWATRNKSLAISRQALQSRQLAMTMPQLGGAQQSTVNAAMTTAQQSAYTAAGGGSLAAAALTGNVRTNPQGTEMYSQA